MADEAPNMLEMNSHLERMAHSMREMHVSSEGIAGSFNRFFHYLVPIGISYKALTALTGQVATNFQHAFKTLSLTTHEILEQRQLAREALQNMRSRLDQGEKVEQQLERLNAIYRINTGLFDAQLNFQDKFNIQAKRALVLYALLVEQGVRALTAAHQLNTAAVEASSNLRARYALMRQALDIQIKTGAAFDDIVSATRALIHYGLDTKSTFAGNLKTVVQLNDALGLSVDESAHLAAVTENYARVSFQKVADVIATIVDQTALAGREVKELAVEMTSVLGLIQPGAATNLPGIVRALSGYESALKEVGGRVGSFRKLIAQLSTPEGLLTAGALGIRPDIVRTEAGIDIVMAKFEQMTRQMVGQATGTERIVRLSSIGQLLNLTSTEVNEMALAVERHKSQVVKTVTVQDRYNEQMLALDQGFTLLIRSLHGLLQQAIYPVVFGLSKVVSWLAQFTQRLTAMRGAVYTAMVVVGLSAVAAGMRLKAAAVAFMEVWAAAKVATAALQQYAREQLASTAVDSLKKGGVAQSAATLLGQAKVPDTLYGKFVAGLKLVWTGAIRPVFSFLFSPLMAIARGIGSLATLTAGISIAVAAAAATLGYLAYRWVYWRREDKIAREESINLTRKIAERSLSLEQIRRQRAYIAQRYGNDEYALKQAHLWLQSVAVRLRDDKRLTSEQREAAFNAEAASLVRDRGKAMYTETMFSPAFSAGNVDKAGITDKIHTSNERIVGVLQAIKAGNEAAVKREEAEKQEEKDEDIWYRLFQLQNMSMPIVPKF